MGLAELAVVSAIVFAFGAVSARVARSWLSAPILFVALGAAIELTGSFEAVATAPELEALSALTLLLILFSDASRIDVRKLRKTGSIPLRLLIVALPLTVAAGALAAWLVFDRVGIWDAVLLGAILAPTDAALGQVVVADPRVPSRVRHALSVENGLNDGICVPLVWFALAGAQVERGVTGAGAGALVSVFSAARSLGVAVVAGAAVGWAACHALEHAAAKGWVSRYASGLPLLATPLLTFALVERLGGSGYIAVYVAGLVMARRSLPAGFMDLSDQSGTLAAILTWGAFGALFLVPTLQHLTLRMLVYALLSLTVVRAVPVALGLIGLKLRWETVAFLGWFGPRGLASVLFGILLHQHTALRHHEHFFYAITSTVVLSILLHGLTALPVTRGYARRCEQKLGGLRDTAFEFDYVEPIRPHCMACEPGPSRCVVDKSEGSS